MLQRFLGYSLMVLSLAACVTINIYFPAAAAEEAARTIVRDVLGNEAPSPQEQQPEESNSEKPHTSLNTTLSSFRWVAEAALNFIVPSAHAAQPNIDISSPSISKLRSSMSSRQSALAVYYRSGALGFTDNGLVAVRDLNLIPLRDRIRSKKMVADENGDRKALYAEIARANGHPEWEESIREIFARVWVEEAPKGYWYQAKGGWKKK
ncbi:MAG: YdbL family protein [Candidatus Thiodiazotropha sp.]|jgi:uncharacterized protein